MSTENGGPAFPVSTSTTDGSGYGHQDGPSTWQYGGMTMRDYFAAKALPGVLYMVAHGVHDQASSAEGCALEAYRLADAMLKERAK